MKYNHNIKKTTDTIIVARGVESLLQPDVHIKTDSMNES